MRRRGGTVVVRCTTPGCREDALYDWHNRAERAEIGKLEKTYLCMKHSRPDEWLRPELAHIETVLVAKRLAGLPEHLFWVRGESTTGNGFAHGPGFCAYAADVPEGAVLRVRATLELPQALAAIDPHGGAPADGPPTRVKS